MHVDPLRVWDIRRTHAFHEGEWIRIDESFWSQWTTFEWADHWRAESEGDVVRASWEAGPFSYPVTPPAYVEERLVGGMAVRSIDGTTHVTFGPWQLVIRGIAARAARKILGVWEIRRSWVTQAGGAARGITAIPRRAGASEQIAGASELHWPAGSEVRLRGASEVFMLGASELRYRGASETLYAGASELRLRGRSEQRFRGASERQHLGASEQRRRPRYPEEQ